MLERIVLQKTLDALNRQSAVALLGPRQVGKTTLALEISRQKPSVYLDLEAYTDRQKLRDPILFLSHNEGKLVILDEIHRMPELFRSLRGVIDDRRRKGLRTGQFLILGSASMDLLRQSGESLAGRIEYVKMTPLNVLEALAREEPPTQLWLRGGFPDSLLASSDENSFAYRKDFIRTYLMRDVPELGKRVPIETMERLWTMLAHSQGQLLNASQLAANLSVSAPTVTNYIDMLVDLLLVRRLPPFHANVKKRLVKSPKIYLKDSGICHALLGLSTYNQLSGHPVFGSSWEGFVIENLLSIAPEWTFASFYRTAAGAEMDLILELPGSELWAIEIKGGLAPKPGKGFYHALEDLNPKKCFIVYAGNDQFPISENVDAISLNELAEELSKRN